MAPDARPRRIDTALHRAREDGRTAFIAYLCAGDPSLEATRRAVPQLVRAGADIIELGIPFSDPMADGAAIQAASARAIAGGTTLPRVLDLVSRLRQDGVEAPIVLMAYAHAVLSRGAERFAADAGRVGA